jgi:hypothetical protein
MGDTQGHSFVVYHKGLGIDDVGLAGGGVADMADGQMSGKALQGFLAENIGNKTHGLVNSDSLAIADYNASAFLAAVLQGVQAEINKFGGILVAENPADAAFMLGFCREFTIRCVRVHSYCLQYCQDASKIERHKEQFLVPVLLLIQLSQEDYLQPDYTFFFNKISGILSE